jgi:hypothetical protein
MPSKYGSTDPPSDPSSSPSNHGTHIQPNPNNGTSDMAFFPRPRSRRRAERTREPGADVLSSFSNLANTIIGSGALAFPAAFASMGLIPGIVSCMASASTAVFGLWLLSRCATLVGVRPGDEGRKASFNEVARLAFGKGWVMRLFDVSRKVSGRVAVGGCVDVYVDVTSRRQPELTPPARNRYIQYPGLTNPLARDRNQMLWRFLLVSYHLQSESTVRGRQMGALVSN